MVNNELGKKNYTYEMAYRKYMNLDNGFNTKGFNTRGFNTKDICMILGIILLIFMILYLIKK